MLALATRLGVLAQAAGGQGIRMHILVPPITPTSVSAANRRSHFSPSSAKSHTHTRTNQRAKPHDEAQRLRGGCGCFAPKPPHKTPSVFLHTLLPRNSCYTEARSKPKQPPVCDTWGHSG